MANDSMGSSMAGPSSSTTPQISGSVPGVLDPTQPDRLLRRPNSTLFFASFDPRAASAQQDIPDIRKLSINEELYKAKRVVVETAASGESFWRFVPKARRDEGVLDEGQWPRVIDICGQRVVCSQEQWEIYKLDPMYICRVCAPPALSMITRAPPKSKDSPQSKSGKRRMMESSPPPDTALPRLFPRKKMHTHPYEIRDDGDDSEVEEVEAMIIDDDEMPSHRARSAGPSERAKKLREEINRNRQERREKLSRRAEKLSRQDGVFFDFTQHNSTPNGQTQPAPPDSAGKRKVAKLFESLSPHEEVTQEECLRNAVNYEQTTYTKRTRTVSPSAAKRDLEAKRIERERQKQGRREREKQGRNEALFEQFVNSLYTDIPATSSPATNAAGGEPSNGVDHPESDDSDDELPNDHSLDDEDAAREAAIAESRRKLAELEADRPLWEEEARRRAQREKKEQEEASRRRAEDLKRGEARNAEAARQAKSRREDQAREEAYMREQQERARRERDKRQRQQRWSYGPWTVQRALERYKSLSETFDSAKYTVDEPLSFDMVPWPVLNSPVTMSVEDVDWAAVEKFFDAVKPHMRLQDFKTFVEKSHRRFHPDRWRSRGVLKSVVDEAEKGCLEVAANTVAQALTPLWRELTGR